MDFEHVTFDLRRALSHLISASLTSLWTKLALLTGGFLLHVLWYGLVIVLLSTPPARAVYDRAGQWIERVVGTALAVFGLRLISEKL
ncbi:LysE family transporter [Mesorhizobium sp. M1329]|uniref:LysE family transporter n=1 Tax=Mesorhizobium sp. M1329 TaxID=2957083 RepID=UPI00333BD053